MASNDAQKPFQTLSPTLYPLIREAVCKDFTRKGRDIDMSRFMFEDVAENFKVRISTPNQRVRTFESGYIGLYVHEKVKIRLEGEGGRVCALKMIP
jgi:hypothetical protein